MENHGGNQEPMVKIQFYDKIIGYENLWAAAIGGRLFKIESIPFFIYDIAVGDLVEADPNDQGELTFTKKSSESGNTTIRARSDTLVDDPHLRNITIGEIEGMGCKVEIHRNRLLAICVPADVPMTHVRNALNRMHLDWEFGSPSNLNK